jgi:hypothetical protein
MAQLNDELMINGNNVYQVYGYKSVLITADEKRVFGSQRSVSVNSMFNGRMTSYEVGKNRPKITIELIKMKKGTRTPEPITHKDLRDLSMLLFRNDVTIVQERNAVYYGWFVNGTTWFNGADQGYLTLEFELASPYAYSPVQTEAFLIQTDNSKLFPLRNVATADEPVYSRIRIIGFQKTGDVKITNRTTNNVITIKNVKHNEEIILEGETREIYSVTNPNENMIPRLEYTNDYLFLKYGENEIFVEGDCQIEFEFQCPMLIV